MIGECRPLDLPFNMRFFEDPAVVEVNISPSASSSSLEMEFRSDSDNAEETENVSAENEAASAGMCRSE